MFSLAYLDPRHGAHPIRTLKVLRNCDEFVLFAGRVIAYRSTF